MRQRELLAGGRTLRGIAVDGSTLAAAVPRLALCWHPSCAPTADVHMADGCTLCDALLQWLHQQRQQQMQALWLCLFLMAIKQFVL